jgi:hypothetical protein
MLLQPTMKPMTRHRTLSGRRTGQGPAPRLFHLHLRGYAINELQARRAAMERSPQRLMERNLVQLLGVNFVASAYPVGARHDGRIDTLDLDMRGAPVVIEYKRTRSATLISEGLFYLDWLHEHRGSSTCW